jgi:hypothetical protein
LNKTAKALGQITAALLFGVLVLQFANADGLTPGSPQLSYVREIATVALPRRADKLPAGIDAKHAPRTGGEKVADQHALPAAKIEQGLALPHSEQIHGGG